MPDQAALNNPGAITATNVIPTSAGYTPLSGSVTYSLATGTPAADDYVRGAFAAKDVDNNVHVYCGDAADLFRLSGTSWANISKSAQGYSGTSTEEQWRFALWGNTVVATNYNNYPQQMTMGAANFIDMTGPTNSFRARYVAQIRDFMVFGGLFDNTEGSVPYRVRWSAFNNANNYTQSGATQSDFQDLYNGGWITGIEGGDYGVIWQEASITKMIYEGPPRIFRFDRVEQNRGCRVPGSIVRYGESWFYLSDEDFYWFNGVQNIPIGAEKIARFFYADLDDNYRHRVTSRVDPRRHLYMISYPGNGNSGGFPNKILIYNWVVSKWSIAEVQAGAMLNFLTPGQTLEDLDTFSASLDDLNNSLDSTTWKGGAPLLGAFNSNHRLYTFDGTPYDATVDTSELRTENGTRHEVTNIRPLVEGGTTTVQVGHRALQTESPTWTSAISANSEGEHNTRVSDRFSRVRLNVTGAWQYIQGADVQVSERGNR